MKNSNYYVYKILIKNVFFFVGGVYSKTAGVDLTGYHNYSQLQEELHSLQESYPHIARYRS